MKRMWIGSTAAASVLTVVLCLASMQVLVPSPVVAKAPVDPDELTLGYKGWDGRITRPLGYWWEQRAGGTWSVEDARLRPDGRLAMHVAITPPEVGLPVDPGPAVLFASAELSGGAGGDVGAWAMVGQPVHATVRPCRRAEVCEYRVKVVLPTHKLRSAADRVTGAVSWGSVHVNLTLVRTFGQRTWVQVLPLEGRGLKGRVGTVSDPGTFRAHTRYFGAFPVEQGERWLANLPREVRYEPMLRITERIRQKGDESEAPANVPFQLDIDAGDCLGWSLMNHAGDVAFDETERLFGREVRTIDVPAGSEWYVRSPSLENIDMPSETVHSFGPFVAEGDGLRIGGSWRCGEVGGAVTASALGTEPEIATSSPYVCEEPSDRVVEEPGVLAGEWSSIAAAPIPGRHSHTATWTGKEVIVWGGIETDADGSTRMPADGAAYDPLTDTWRPISEAPIKGRIAHSAVWAGDRLIVFGGRRGDRLRGDGAAYFPESDTWRPIPKLESDLRRRSHHAFWTGEEMLIWSGVGPSGSRYWRDDVMLAYDPSTDDWYGDRSPLFRRWGPDGLAGDEELVFAVSFGGGERPEMAAYEVSTEQWYDIAQPQVSGESLASPIWTGAELLLLQPDATAEDPGLPTSAAYDPSGSCWRRVSTAMPPHSAVSVPAWTGELAVFAGREGLAYDPDADRWLALPVDDRAARTDTPFIWAGDRVFAWGGADLATGAVLEDGVTHPVR